MDSFICALMAGRQASNADAQPTSASAALISAIAENAAPLRATTGAAAAALQLEAHHRGAHQRRVLQMT